MILTSPVCHTHYFMLAIPLVMGLLASRWERLLRPGHGQGTGQPLGAGWVVLVLGQIAGTAVPLLPGMELFKDIGLTTYTVMVLWLLAAVRLNSNRKLGAGSAELMPGPPQASVQAGQAA
jgi:hypothetical protein